MKRLFVIGGAVLALLLVPVLTLPFVIDPNRFRPLLESELSRALARNVTLGNLKLSLLAGSVNAADLSIADDPAYGKAPFVKAKSLAIGVELWPLLSSRKLHVTGLTIDQPAVSLIQSASGEWNFSSLGGTSKVQSPAVASNAPKADLDLSVKLIKITGGEFSLGHTPGNNKPLTLRDVNIEVKDFSAAKAFPFTLSAKVAGGGTVELNGTAGPVDPADTAASPLAVNLKLDSLDLAGTGLAQNVPALAGIISLEGSGQSDGKIAHMTGKLKAEGLRLAREGAPAKKPVTFDFALDHNLRGHSGQLHRGDLHIGSAAATLTGKYAREGETTALNMRLSGPKMAISELSVMLPAMAVTLPRGSVLQGGSASVNLSVSGPLHRLITTGRVSLDDTRLAGFDIGRKLAFIQALAGIQASPDTAIQTLGAAIWVGPDGAKVDNLQFVVPTLGALEGGGAVSPANELAFQMRATVRAAGNTAIPFLVQGTATDPTFHPDVKGIARQELNNVLNGQGGVKGILDGILGGRKR